MSADSEILYDVKTVAEIYNNQPIWIYRLIKKGAFPNAFKPEFSEKWSIPESDIDSRLLKAWKIKNKKQEE